MVRGIYRKGHEIQGYAIQKETSPREKGLTMRDEPVRYNWPRP
jgi:hypothetical protein